MTLCFEKDKRFTCHVENVKRAGSLGEWPGKKPLCTVAFLSLLHGPSRHLEIPENSIFNGKMSFSIGREIKKKKIIQLFLRTSWPFSPRPFPLSLASPCPWSQKLRGVSFSLQIVIFL